jgi:hypothetical protein
MISSAMHSFATNYLESITYVLSVFTYNLTLKLKPPSQAHRRTATPIKLSCYCYAHRYQLAVGTSPGGGQIKHFMDVPIDFTHYTVQGLDLSGESRVSRH